jgi:RNA methyltransferase, TrmH family
LSIISSRANPRVRRWRDLALDARERRRAQRAMVEGPHLLAACIAAGVTIENVIISEAGGKRGEIRDLLRRTGKEPIVLANTVFELIADAETPQGVAAEIHLPGVLPDVPASKGCVFLDEVQDGGNVGAILRSAAAFGYRDAVLGRGCADPWSPKVLRAAMGAHFGLRILADADLGAALDSFGGTLACAVPRGGEAPEQVTFPPRLGWLFGAEGRGVQPGLAARASLCVSLPMAAGSESLNVAAAAAICLYVSRRGA